MANNVESLINNIYMLLESNECTSDNDDGSYTTEIAQKFSQIFVEENAESILENLERVIDLMFFINSNSIAPEVSSSVIDKSLTNVLRVATGHFLGFKEKNEFLKGLNILLESCDVSTKDAILKKESFDTVLKKFADQITTIGDYEYQVGLVECLFRIIPKKRRFEYAKKFFTSRDLRKQFEAIRDQEFELDCRLFLNDFNQHQGKNTGVRSIPCLSVQFGNRVLQKPSDDGYDDFWVDFNFGSQRITIFCEEYDLSSQCSVEDAWETLSVWSQDVQHYKLLDNGESQRVEIQMLQSLKFMYPSQTSSVGRHIILDFDKYIDILQVLKRTLGAGEKLGQNQENVLKISSATESVKIARNMDYLEQQDQLEEGKGEEDVISESPLCEEIPTLVKNKNMSKILKKVSVPLNPINIDTSQVSEIEESFDSISVSQEKNQNRGQSEIETPRGQCVNKVSSSMSTSSKVSQVIASLKLGSDQHQIRTPMISKARAIPSIKRTPKIKTPVVSVTPVTAEKPIKEMHVQTKSVRQTNSSDRIKESKERLPDAKLYGSDCENITSHGIGKNRMISKIGGKETDVEIIDSPGHNTCKSDEEKQQKLLKKKALKDPVNTKKKDRIQNKQTETKGKKNKPTFDKKPVMKGNKDLLASEENDISKMIEKLDSSTRPRSSRRAKDLANKRIETTMHVETSSSLFGALDDYEQLYEHSCQKPVVSFDEMPKISSRKTLKDQKILSEPNETLGEDSAYVSYNTTELEDHDESRTSQINSKAILEGQEKLLEFKKLNAKPIHLGSDGEEEEEVESIPESQMRVKKLFHDKTFTHSRVLESMCYQSSDQQNISIHQKKTCHIEIGHGDKNMQIKVCYQRGGNLECPPEKRDSDFDPYDFENDCQKQKNVAKNKNVKQLNDKNMNKKQNKPANYQIGDNPECPSEKGDADLDPYDFDNNCQKHRISKQTKKERKQTDNAKQSKSNDDKTKEKNYLESFTKKWQSKSKESFQWSDTEENIDSFESLTGNPKDLQASMDIQDSPASDHRLEAAEDDVDMASQQFDVVNKLNTLNASYYTEQKANSIGLFKHSSRVDHVKDSVNDLQEESDDACNAEFMKDNFDNSNSQSVVKRPIKRRKQYSKKSSTVNASKDLWTDVVKASRKNPTSKKRKDKCDDEPKKAAVESEEDQPFLFNTDVGPYKKPRKTAHKKCYAKKPNKATRTKTDDTEDLSVYYEPSPFVPSRSPRSMVVEENEPSTPFVQQSNKKDKTDTVSMMSVEDEFSQQSEGHEESHEESERISNPLSREQEMDVCMSPANSVLSKFKRMCQEIVGADQTNSAAPKSKTSGKECRNKQETELKSCLNPGTLSREANERLVQALVTPVTPALSLSQSSEADDMVSQTEADLPEDSQKSCTQSEISDEIPTKFDDFSEKPALAKSGFTKKNRPTRSTLKRKYEVDNEDGISLLSCSKENDGWKEDCSHLQPKKLFSSAYKCTEVKVSSRSELEGPCSSVPSCASMDDFRDILDVGSEMDQTIGSFMKAFGLDLHKKMNTTQKEIKELGCKMLEAIMQEIKCTFRENCKIRNAIWGNFNDKFLMEIQEGEKDVKALQEAERETMDFLKQQLHRIQQCRASQETRLNNLLSFYKDLDYRNKKAETVIHKNQETMGCRMRANLLELQKKLLLDSQKREISKMKQNLQRLLAC